PSRASTSCSSPVDHDAGARAVARARGERLFRTVACCRRVRTCVAPGTGRRELAAVLDIVGRFELDVVLSQRSPRNWHASSGAVRGLPWCCINSTYYFGAGSLRCFAADVADAASPARDIVRQFMAAMADADLVLHGTDPLFDPPTPALPRT